MNITNRYLVEPSSARAVLQNIFDHRYRFDSIRAAYWLVIATYPVVVYKGIFTASTCYGIGIISAGMFLFAVFRQRYIDKRINSMTFYEDDEVVLTFDEQITIHRAGTKMQVDPADIKEILFSRRFYVLVFYDKSYLPVSRYGFESKAARKSWVNYISDYQTITI